ncbi:MAG: hypothetical protein WA194_05995, partial [Patescibacteria group bacterium]
MPLGLGRNRLRFVYDRYLKVCGREQSRNGINILSVGVHGLRHRARDLQSIGFWDIRDVSLRKELVLGKRNPPIDRGVSFAEFSKIKLEIRKFSIGVNT